LLEKKRKENNFYIPAEIEQYERKIFDLKQLIEISKGLNSTLDYNALIDSILFTCMGQMQLLRAGIFLSKGLEHDVFTLHRNYKGFDVDHSIEYEIETKSDLVDLLETKNRALTMEEIEEIFPTGKDTIILQSLHPDLIVPLMGKGQLNGIMIFADRINQSTFSEKDKEYLLNIASLAGIAIQNATLYEMATTDMMTHLKIHHYFQTIMIEEFERSSRSKRPLSLIMMDIDFFKAFNDTYGHSAGDVVIKTVAQIIKDSIRLMDIAARYGGEEFVVILPKTDITEALIVAERIRETIEKKEIFFEGKKMNVTISLGITELDHDLDTCKDDVIKRSDRALYISKENGRNQVSFL